ncbi:hypothetical protein J6590_056988 [Homalodisca vitripennis]|nr:hypothetical protein J6590_056988 [Homalodisca vitripennis]
MRRFPVDQVWKCVSMSSPVAGLCRPTGRYHASGCVCYPTRTRHTRTRTRTHPSLGWLEYVWTIPELVFKACEQHAPNESPILAVYAFQLNLHWVQQKPLCHWATLWCKGRWIGLVHYEDNGWGW